jgi:hypothetical protein
MRLPTWTFSAALFLALTSQGLYAGIIVSGDHILAPNQANQTIEIYASPTFAGEIAPGLNLNVVIDDGGSIVGGVDNNSPRITSVNLKPAGGLFDGIPDSQSNLLESQKLYQVTIAPTGISNRPVITDGVLLAQITLDTTGLTSGSWVLDLDGLPAVGLPSSDFAGSPTTVINGVLIVTVPELSSLWALASACSLMILKRTRRS